MLNLRLDTLALHIKKREKTKSLCDFFRKKKHWKLLASLQVAWQRRDTSRGSSSRQDSMAVGILMWRGTANPIQRDIRAQEHLNTFIFPSPGTAGRVGSVVWALPAADVVTKWFSTIRAHGLEQYWWIHYCSLMDVNGLEFLLCIWAGGKLLKKKKKERENGVGEFLNHFHVVLLNLTRECF